ncbi:Asp_protease_2 domain-containing protein [Cucumis melo var. makuwa]|uniref:Asp_protease_2 domain-containing protein n=1 Tax=Cucumis melo var. makuwa TaxID=1194695 RepID=A0A5D3CTL7_CUCMM|nr:Asp_protease_2 domain-containing protein [Cucumis melo var. makuwa]TYK14558.1 Asp_protease_2 domain-containing protein [Cucumis melo var. makuwa]
MVDSGATHNFITEVEARHLRLHWKKDSERMKVVNFVALSIVGLVKRTMMKLGGWKGPVDFVVVKMDNFDVVLGMEFLLEHQVILMPSAKCLVITGFFPTVVRADIRQPNRFKTILVIQLNKNPARVEPTFVAILLEAWGKPKETVLKDTMCVLEKYHGMMPNSRLKSLLPRRMIDHMIELLLEAQASVKNTYRRTPPELAELQKQLKELLNTGFSKSIQAPHRLSVPRKSFEADGEEGGSKVMPLEFQADDHVSNQWGNNVVLLSVDWKQEEDREVREIFTDRVRKGRRPTREIHKFLVKWKNLPVELTSQERVEDLEASKQKIEEFQLHQLTMMSTV